MAEKIVVEAALRESRGKNEARRLRVVGKVPAILYGAKGEALSLAVSAKQVGQILRSASGHNTLFQVALGGKEQPAVPPAPAVTGKSMYLVGFHRGIVDAKAIPAPEGEE